MIATAPLQDWLAEAAQAKPVTNGWIPDERGLVAATEAQPWYDELRLSFDLAAATYEDDDGDRFPWRLWLADRPELFRADPRTGLPRMLSTNQGDAGTCVGAADARNITVTSLLDIYLRGEPEQYIAEGSIEWIYAIGRQVAGQLGNWDGSTCSWSTRGLEEVGALFQLKYGDIDLRKYDPRRAQQWARTGPPASLRATAGKTKLLRSLRIRSAKEWWSAIGLGYTVNLCSSWGGSGKRDSEGVMRRSGSWQHSMSSWWRRMSKRLGRLFGVQQSWSSGWAEDSSDTEEPDDMPWAGFYVDEDEADWICRNGEVIARCNVDGFKAPKADWGHGYEWAKAGFHRPGPRPPRVQFDGPAA